MNGGRYTANKESVWHDINDFTLYLGNPIIFPIVIMLK